MNSLEKMHFLDKWWLPVHLSRLKIAFSELEHAWNHKIEYALGQGCARAEAEVEIETEAETASICDALAQYS